jgi:hypothetical protein
MKTAQKVGVAGLLVFLLGISFTALLPWAGVNLGGEGYLLGFAFSGVGSALFFVGVVWAWTVGFADATRAWDNVRRPLFCPVCGQRYPEDLGHTCPRDGSELRPVA